MFTNQSMGEGFVPVGVGQHNLALTTAGGVSLTVPTGATSAVVQAAGAAVKYTTDGSTAPTSTVGMTLAAGGTVMISGAASLKNFKAFSSTGTLDVEFYQG